MITRIVSKSESGKRLHRYLRQLMPNYPLGQIYKMIDKGKVRVNGKRKKQNYELAEGDEITLFIDEETFQKACANEKKTKFAGVSKEIDILYEDEELLVVNKPAGLLTHPDKEEYKDTLINRVHAYLYDKGELDSRLFLPATANRLDRNTSGVVLIGKTAKMLHQLNQWIKNREIEKFYLTVVEGELKEGGEIDSSIVRSEKKNRTYVVKGMMDGPKNGKEALTRYSVLEVGKGYTLVKVELETGRTHQIRAHFQSIGHPLLGDIKYGGKPVKGIRHQILHSWRIKLPDGREFTAPLPARYQKLFSYLGFRKYI